MSCLLLASPSHGHRTGIHDAQISRFMWLGFTVAILLEHFLDMLCLVLIDLAADGQQAAGTTPGSADY